MGIYLYKTKLTTTEDQCGIKEIADLSKKPKANKFFLDGLGIIKTCEKNYENKYFPESNVQIQGKLKHPMKLLMMYKKRVSI